jgi:hypothetical protein
MREWSKEEVPQN